VADERNALGEDLRVPIDEVDAPRPLVAEQTVTRELGEPLVERAEATLREIERGRGGRRRFGDVAHRVLGVGVHREDFERVEI
jgi:hypothetical protein